MKKLFLLLPLLLTLARSSDGADAAGSARQFVQSFYNWYLPLSNSPLNRPACDEALNQRPKIFSSSLYRGLKKETNAQARSTGLAGLGFDPFLNSQDPAPRYVVGNVSEDGNHYMVDVYGIFAGRKRGRADLRARVKQENGRWVFTDFYYPDGRTLKNLLGKGR